MRKRLEDTIRDYLVEDISLLGKDLAVIDKEKYVPNDLGTKGFIDILAKDTRGNFVIIELKRSEASSREAIHEVFKYVEGIKRQQLANDGEIRVIVVSTEWDELRVPFSAFARQVNYTVEGLHLEIAPDGRPLKVFPEPPLPTMKRVISPKHSICMYTTEEQLQSGIKSYETVYPSKGIRDFLLVILDAPADYHERAKATFAAGLESISRQFPDSPVDISGFLKRLPTYGHMIYSAILRLSKEDYLFLLRTDEAVYQEVLEYIADPGLSEEYVLHILEDHLLHAVEPNPLCEHYEGGNPNKFSTDVLDNGGWTIREVRRHGRLQDNKVLTDEQLLHELRGRQGIQNQMYTAECHSSHKARLHEIYTEALGTLIDVPIWQHHVKFALEQCIETAKARRFTLRIHIYNPSNILLSIFQVVSALHPFEAGRWIPMYYIRVLYDDSQESLMYSGQIIDEGRHPTLSELLERFYDNDTFALLFPLSWGGYNENDREIMRYIGLRYSSFRCDRSGDELQFSEFRDFEFFTVNSRLDPFEGFYGFLLRNRRFVQQLADLFSRHWDGQMIRA
jgi:hypothetical protein